MFPGETVATGASNLCGECAKVLELQVCSTPRGFFLGYWCDEHGVHTRETGWYPKEETVKRILEKYLGSGILVGQRT